MSERLVLQVVSHRRSTSLSSSDSPLATEPMADTVERKSEWHILGGSLNLLSLAFIKSLSSD